MSGPDIFISYSREDRAAARHFAECFEKEGFSVWWDAALHSGETFDEVIESALKAAKAVVVLWSPRSVASRWVRAEATLADRRDKLAPVVIEPCDRPIIFELTHTADLAEWTGDTTDAGWKTFVKDLHRLVERDPAAPPPRAGGRVARDAARAPTPSRYSHRAADESSADFSPAKVDDLMSALSSLQSAISKSKVNDRRSALLSRAEPDEGERTQFYTRPGVFDPLAGTEFHCLEIATGDRLEQRFIVSRIGLKIGRSPPADIVLADGRVSRTHCMVELTGDEVRVSDLGSTNGTFVDGEQIRTGALLPVGSTLKVGSVSFTHQVRSKSEI